MFVDGAGLRFSDKLGAGENLALAVHKDEIGRKQTADGGGVVVLDGELKFVVEGGEGLAVAFGIRVVSGCGAEVKVKPGLPGLAVVRGALADLADAGRLGSPCPADEVRRVRSLLRAGEDEGAVVQRAFDGNL